MNTKPETLTHDEGRELIDGCLQAESARPAPELAGAHGAFAVVGGSHAVPSAEENRLRGLLDDANAKLHALQCMMSEAGFPMRVKWGEDLHGNEDWVRVRPECQLRDVLRRLAELTTERQPQENTAIRHGEDGHTQIRET